MIALQFIMSSFVLYLRTLSVTLELYASNDWMLLNSMLKGVRKEAIIARLKIRSRYLPWETKGNLDNPQ